MADKNVTAPSAAGMMKIFMQMSMIKNITINIDIKIPCATPLRYVLVHDAKIAKNGNYAIQKIIDVTV